MNTLFVQPKNKAQEDVLIALAESWQIKCGFLDTKMIEDKKIADFFSKRQNKTLLTDLEAELFLQKLGK